MSANRRSALIATVLMLFGIGAVSATGVIRAFAKGSWHEIREAHAGRPMIVHLWGLTCAPCRIEMPEWGKLLQEKPAADLVIVHAERAPPKPELVAEALAHAGLQGAENWMFIDNFLERLRFEIDPKWHGELPATLLIAPDATTRMIVGPADMSSVRQWIDTQKGVAK
jgi:thiol-disulfide isomerase/thioredoxin